MALHEVLMLHVGLKVTLQKPRERTQQALQCPLLPLPALRRPVSAHVVPDKSKMGTVGMSSRNVLPSTINSLK